MNFYLVRHGEAVSEAMDPQRPLSPLGREDVVRVAQLSVEKQVRVSAIYHSGILRAQQTAEILAQRLRPPSGFSVLAGLQPMDDPAGAAAELAIATEPIMLVGHMPFMGRLAATLTTGDSERSVVAFAPAMIVCYAREPKWQVNWILTPPGSAS